MNIERLRIHRARSRWLEGVLSRNPVFVQGLALPFAIMITTNLKSAVAVSILMACSLIPCVLLASVLGTRVPDWALLMICATFSMVLLMAALPLVKPIAPEITDSLGIYIPILALNSILSFLCLRHRKKFYLGVAFVDAVTYSFGFALALCLIAGVREVFGTNTIWGVPVTLPVKFGGLEIAFSGFIITALFCALFRTVGRCVRGRIYRHSNPRPGTEIMP